MHQDSLEPYGLPHLDRWVYPAITVSEHRRTIRNFFALRLWVFRVSPVTIESEEPAEEDLDAKAAPGTATDSNFTGTRSSR